MAHPLRKIVRKFGIDIHRHRSVPHPLQWLARQGIRTVFDIGANVGQFALETREHLPQAKIFSFEPLADCYDLLVKNFRDDSSFFPFPYALGDKNETTLIHQSAYAPSSSLLPMSPLHQKLFPHTQEHSTKQATVKRLDDLASELDWQKELLIKMDVQGYEGRVLMGGERTFAQALAVITEISFVELYEKQASFDQLYQSLKNLGFSYAGSLGQKTDHHGQIISQDSLFLKN